VAVEHNKDSAGCGVRSRQAHFSLPFSMIAFEDGSKRNLGSQVVTMMQTAEPRHRFHLATGSGTFPRFTSSRRTLTQRQMSSVRMIVTNVIIHEAIQMSHIENDHVIEQVAAAAANPTLCNPVLPRTSEAGPLRLNGEAHHCVNHVAIEV
jgi:hypothetical protein